MEETEESKGRKKIYYGCYVVITCCVMCMVMIGLMNNASSNYIVPITTELKIDRSEFMVGNLISLLAGSIPIMFIFKIYKKISYRILLPIGFALYCTGYFMQSQVTAVYQIYIIQVLQALFGGISGVSGFVVVSSTVNNWFIKNRGFTLAIVSSFSGIGGAIFNPLVAALIKQCGWRTTYQIMAAIIFVLFMPLLLAFMYLKPSDKGLKPYGEDGSEVSRILQAKQGILRKEALRQPNFWITFIMFFMISFSCQGLLLNSSPIYIEAGHDALFAATISSITMISMIIGKYIMGYLYDRIGFKCSSAIFYSLLALGMFILLFRKTNMFAYIGASVCGMAIASNTMVPPLAAPTLFGELDSGNIFSVLSIAPSIGTAFGSIIPSVVYDFTGSYQYMLVIWIIMCIVSIIVLIFLIQWKKSVNNPGRARES